ncbi:MAG: hypothetical protein NC818_07615 [Candidatus Omnitrophica bacterium]|nr:hypothetical protein [Candidatus Omnitrophota bacterium]
MAVDLSALAGAEQIKKINENTAVKYKVIEESIDLEALRQEKANLEALLVMEEPTEEELLQEGKIIHPYYSQKEYASKRIAQINEILK